MALTQRVQRPTATGELVALEEPEELSDEALSGYGSDEDEKKDEEEDKKKDEEEDDDESSEEELEEMESFARHPEEHHPRPVKLNKHQAMMKAKEMAAEREKVILERKAKEKMRKHIEEYEEAMKKKRRKMKHFLPYHQRFYNYYSKPEKASGQVYQRARRGIKAMLKSVPSTQETETMANIVEERSIHASQMRVQEQMSHQSMVSETDQTPLQTGLRQMMHLQIEEEKEEVTTPKQSLRKPVSQQISRETSKNEIKKGVHFYLDRRRWEDEEMIAKGWGTQFGPRFTTPVEPTGDSGLGESILTGTSQLLTGTGASDIFSESVIGTKHGGSGGIHPGSIESIRPRSNLTRANVRRHELLSAHKEARDSEIVVSLDALFEVFLCKFLNHIHFITCYFVSLSGCLM